MPKKSPAAYVLFAVVSIAGILADARRKRSTAGQASAPSLIPPPAGPASRPNRIMRTGINVMMFASLAGIIALASLPLIARAVPASNEDIRNHYGINVIDNPNFQGNTFLQGGEEGLAHVCDRPNFHALNNSEEISCWTP